MLRVFSFFTPKFLFAIDTHVSVVFSRRLCKSSAHSRSSVIHLACSDCENSTANSSKRSSQKYLRTRHLVYPAHENCRRSRAARAGAITNEIIYRDRGARSPRRISGRAQPGVINVPEGQENRSPSGTDPYEIKILPPGRAIRLLVSPSIFFLPLPPLLSLSSFSSPLSLSTSRDKLALDVGARNEFFVSPNGNNLQNV